MSWVRRDRVCGIAVCRQCAFGGRAQRRCFVQTSFMHGCMCCLILPFQHHLSPVLATMTVWADCVLRTAGAELAFFLCFASLQGWVSSACRVSVPGIDRTGLLLPPLLLRIRRRVCSWVLLADVSWPLCFAFRSLHDTGMSLLRCFKYPWKTCVRIACVCARHDERVWRRVLLQVPLEKYVCISCVYARHDEQGCCHKLCALGFVHPCTAAHAMPLQHMLCSMMCLSWSTACAALLQY